MKLAVVVVVLVLTMLHCPVTAKKSNKKDKKSKASYPGPPLADLSSSILVTGAAGFIGNHLAGHLHKTGFKTVVGLDTFNAYYSPALKRERAKNLLQETGVEIVDGDVCDASLLRSLISEYKFTHIVHLAAQAGVRYSMVQPMTYIQANLKCFTVLLEEVRAIGTRGEPMPHLLYASSSSVYGLNKKIPFSEIDPVEMPSNLYGATKRANELMAYSYHHLFNVSSIGFRFFTVYGPWGRPDMAAYIFSDLISQGKTLTVYNQGQMKRDFTYVDDIVAGLTAALNYKHKKPAVFNLGNNKPVEAMRFLSIIEKELGMKAKVRFEDSKAEIPVTFANVTLVNRELGFRAKTSIEEGMKNFIAWYRAHESAKIACESGCQHGTMCVQSSFSEPIAKSQQLTKGCTKVVYTVALGEAVESLHHVDQFWGNGASTAAADGTVSTPPTCSIAFVSDNGVVHKAASRVGASHVISNWTVVPVAVTDHSEIRRIARLPKIVPDKFFAPSVKHAIFIDNKIGLKKHPNQLVNLLSSPSKQGSSSGMKSSVLMAVRNPQRTTLQEEMLELSSRGGQRHTAEATIVGNQWKAYQDYQTREKFSYANMIDSSLLVHDLKMPEGREFRCKWYREFQDWSDRDQLAAAFVIGRAAKVAGADPKARDGGTEFVPISRAPAATATGNSSSNSNSSGDSVKYVHFLPAKEFHWMYVNELAKSGRWENSSNGNSRRRANLHEARLV